MLLSIFVFCVNWHGKSVLLLVINNVDMCAVKLYEILKVKNAMIKSVY